MKMNHAMALAAVVVTSVLGGCASSVQNDPPVARPYPAGSQSYPMPARTYSSQYGMVDSIQVSHMTGDGANGIGAGAVVGGLVGGALGNRVGGGSGRKAATVAGVVGGAMVGHEIERRNSARQMYQVGVRLDNGGYRTVIQDSVADLQIGSRVRIESDRAYRY